MTPAVVFVETYLPFVKRRPRHVFRKQGLGYLEMVGIQRRQGHSVKESVQCDRLRGVRLQFMHPWMSSLHEDDVARL